MKTQAPQHPAELWAKYQRMMSEEGGMVAADWLTRLPVAEYKAMVRYAAEREFVPVGRG